MACRGGIATCANAGGWGSQPWQARTQWPPGHLVKPHKRTAVDAGNDQIAATAVMVARAEAGLSVVTAADMFDGRISQEDYQRVVAHCAANREQLVAAPKATSLMGGTTGSAEMAERAVRESEERLQLAFSAGKFGHWQLTLPGLELTASEQCRADFGRAAEEPFTYEMLNAAIHPDDRARVAAAISQAIAERSSFEASYSSLWPDGSVHSVLGRGRVHCDARGNPDRIVGTTLEVTERKRAENLLIEQNRLLEFIARGRPLDECLDAITEIAPGGEPHPDTEQLFHQLTRGAPMGSHR